MNDKSASGDSSHTGVVSFRRMQDGTREDYELLDRLERLYVRELPDHVLDALTRLDHSFGGYQISRLQHSLQAATRALQDGADDELVVAALIHDVGDELAPCNHAQLSAAMIKPYVRPEVTWIVEHHGVFQMYYYAHFSGGNRHARDKFREHPWYASCVNFCANWDQCSFDPAYPTQPLAAFESKVREIFSRPAHDARFVAPSR
jgi:predicted HD phosphohydrolase